MRSRHLLSLFMFVVGVAMLVAAVSVGVAGSAVKKAGSAEAPTRAGTLRLNMADADFDFVDPQLAYRTDDWSMIYATSMPLVGFEEKTGAAGAQLDPAGRDGLPDRLEGRQDVHVPHPPGPEVLGWLGGHRRVVSSGRGSGS